MGVGIAVAAVAHTAAAAAWSNQPAPTPTHSTGTALSAVSCTSTRNCVAVGDSTRATDASIPLVERWDGAEWSIQRTPIPSRPHWMGFLEGVSCTSSTACTAVGWSTDDTLGTVPLAERWDGSSWTIERTPHPSGEGEFNDVSCASSTACIAVGAGQESFADRWDGKRWSLQDIRFGDPLGRANELSGVSCAPTGACAAVGWDDIGLCADEYESDYTVPVLGFWTSGRWALRRHPNIACSGSSRGEAYLNSVSCTSTAACTAVGTEIERWNGRRWSVQAPRIGTAELRGVSCTSKNACIAVGSEILTWNGQKWSSSAISRPAGTTAGLAGVSCAPQEYCVAVGGYVNPRGPDSLLIEATER